MSALAEILKMQGAEVTGSDISVNIAVDHFNQLGINVHTTKMKITLLMNH